MRLNGHRDKRGEWIGDKKGIVAQQDNYTARLRIVLVLLPEGRPE